MKIEWLDRALFRVDAYYCLALNEKDFRQILKRLKIDRDIWPGQYVSPNAAATTWTFESEKNGKACIVGYRHKKHHSTAMVAGLMAHEAVHIWQDTRDSLGEKFPASEQEAYAIQNITTELMASFLLQRRKVKKHGK